MSLEREIGERVAKACACFPGLDFKPRPIRDQLRRYDPATRGFVPHIKRASWLTLVSDRALAKWGGRDAAVRELEAGPERSHIRPVAAGIVIQAGERPALGGPEVPDALASYRHVARVLSRIRLPSVTYGGRGFPDSDVQTWLEALEREA